MLLSFVPVHSVLKAAACTLLRSLGPVHVNLGDENERDMLRDLGQVSSVANSWGMPVLAMVYARGPKVADSFDPQVVAHCARAGEELGADVIKVNYTGSVDSFQKVVESCCVPVVIAGGPKLDDREDLLRMASEAVQAGAAGLSIGRNIFQDHQPHHLVQALHYLLDNAFVVGQILFVDGGESINLEGRHSENYPG